MSHHLGRWRLNEDTGGARVASALVRISRENGGRYEMKQVHGAQPFESNDPDSGRIWWSEVGVHQNLTFPVQPDPVSGMHCWHQRVHLEKAGPDDSLRRHRRRHGQVRTRLYKEWMAKTRPAPGPGRNAASAVVRSSAAASASAYKVAGSSSRLRPTESQSPELQF